MPMPKQDFVTPTEDVTDVTLAGDRGLRLAFEALQLTSGAISNDQASAELHLRSDHVLQIHVSPQTLTCLSR
jgi:hypothetical protein